MCTVILLRRPGHAWPLIVAANRDERTDRAAKAPARHWSDRPLVVAGQDVLAGGTWLGLSDYGLIAGVLNRRGSLGPQAGFRSRGEIPLEALDHADAKTAARALADLNPQAYRPFNAFVADHEAAYWLRLAAGPDGAAPADAQVEMHPLEAGITMITASDANDAGSPRVRHYLQKFRTAPPPEPETGSWQPWEDLMASRERAPGTGPEGAMVVATDYGFATVSSSLLALPAPGSGRRPLWAYCEGPPRAGGYQPVPL